MVDGAPIRMLDASGIPGIVFYECSVCKHWDADWTADKSDVPSSRECPKCKNNATAKILQARNPQR